MGNPYSPPEAATGLPASERWPLLFWPPFLSSVVSIPVGLVFFGAYRRVPDLLFRPEFVLPLIAASIASALVLRPYTSANWLVRVILGPPISFGVMMAIMVALRVFSHATK